jgi:hypothetical protein
MTRPEITFHNVLTGEVVVRELNDEEFAVYQADQAADTIRKAEAEAKAAEKAVILARLGLTEDELKTILGVN